MVFNLIIKCKFNVFKITKKKKNLEFLLMNNYYARQYTLPFLEYCCYHEIVTTYFDSLWFLVDLMGGGPKACVIGVFGRLVPPVLCLSVGRLFFVFKTVCGPWFNSLLEMVIIIWFASTFD